MNFEPHTLAGFVDELAKIASSHGRMHVPKARTGRRPMTVDTLLKKDKDGTLFKGADSAGSPQDVRAGATDEGAAPLPKHRGEVPGRPSMIPDAEKTGSMFVQMSEAQPPAPRSPKKKGDVPSMDDPNTIDRMDGRGEATTVTGLAQRSSDIGVSNGEHA